MIRMLWVILMMSSGATFITPLFPVYGEHYHLTSLQITVLFAVYAAALLPALLIVGAKGSEWGLKRVLRASVWLSVASTLLFLASFDAWMVYAARLLEGIAYGAFTGSAVAFLLKQVSPNKMGSAIKLSGVTISVGFGVGPAIAGLVLQYLGVRPLHMPFWFLLAMLASALVVLETLPGHDAASPSKPAKSSTISLGIPADIRSHFWSMIALPVFTVFTLHGIAFSLIPSFAKNVIHTSNLSVSGLLILLLLGGGAVAQFSPWPSPILRMRLGILFLAIGSWGIVASGHTGSLPLLWAAILIQAVGGGWTFQVALRLAGHLPRPEERHRVISAFYLCGYSGFIVPVVGVGVLTQFLNLTASLVVLNLFAAAIVIYVLAYSAAFQRFYSKAAAV
ncbi:MFS transporter [Paenibacillus humicola]|uniref:MFS transporter n=1 Tax=Paenibacillus humicola TaxID=3110540 RepID=UPI00237AC634|nr:MFS transporter [Paenibacillus humicola]